MENFVNKEFISELGRYTLGEIIKFSKYYENDNMLETSYSNWNVRDVIAHINSWVKFSGDKLESIKTKQAFKDVYHNGIEQLNRKNYEKNKAKSLDDTVNEARIIFNNYKNVLDLYDENELLSKEFPTGFSCALWEYMALDLYIHPVNHLLYQYLKRKDYNEFINEVENSKKYSNNNAEIFNFSDLFEQKAEREIRLNELLDIIKNSGNDLIVDL
jgi:uncharacterized protein YaaR (DUF327 family)